MTGSILVAGVVVLTFALIPSVLHARRGQPSALPFSVSVPTFVGASMIAVALFLLGQTLGAALTAVNAALWGVLVAQRVRFGGLGRAERYHKISEFGRQNGHQPLTWTEDYELTRLRRYDRLDREDCS